MAGQTTTLHDRRGKGDAQAPGDCLVLALDCARPLVRPRRASLAGVESVVFGRADVDRFRRAGQVLHVDLATRSVSSVHARLTRAGERWHLADEGSKNGTWVNGARIGASRVVGPDDVVEVGTALFLVRPGTGDTPDWDDLPAGLRTLSAELEPTLALVRRIAPAAVPLLILGETGTGKEVLARAVHELSGRAGTFTAVNCGGLPESLVSSELFGSKKGAFSGADANRIGLVQQADGGTLFLDEIAELPLPAQAVLLRVLQEQEVTPLGATVPVKVDARILAATNVDLLEAVAQKRFRRDLYARLGGVTVTLPPLRARREDIGLLVADLLPRLGGAHAGKLTVERTAARALFSYDWPLNIRELAHALSAAVAVAPAHEIRLEDLPTSVAPRAAPPPAQKAAPPDVALADEIEALERARISQALAAADGVKARAARALGMPLRTFTSKLKQYGIR